MAYSDKDKERAYHRNRYHANKKLQNAVMLRDELGRLYNSNPIVLPTDDIIISYNAGESTFSLSKKYGVDKTKIGRLLKKNGVTLRNSLELASLRSGDKNPRYNGYMGITGFKWGVIVHCANVRNLDLTITIKDVWDLFVSQNGLCALSGLPIILPTNCKDYQKSTASLDRIDSSKGYISGNVQWVHKDVNLMRWWYSINHFLFLCDIIVNHADNPYYYYTQDEVYDENFISRSQWYNIKNAPKYRKCKNIECLIDCEDIWNQYIKQGKRCALSGLPINFHKTEAYTASVDRTDSNKGYTIDNIQIVHRDINMIKCDMTVEKLIEWCCLIKEYNETCNNVP